MKKLLYVLFTLISAGSLKAQNWRPIQYERIPLFAAVFDSVITSAIKIDSVTTAGNGDSLLWNYKIENPDCPCDNISSAYSWSNLRCSFRDTGWLGYPATINDNQLAIVTINDDTLYINPNASIGSTWKFAKAKLGKYIEAKVQSAYTINVLGNTDSVKQIVLTRMSATGTPLFTNWTGNYEIICSKNNGIIAGFPFYFFDPSYDTAFIFQSQLCRPFYLAGFQNGPGRKLPTNETIYDFQVGDKFHYLGEVYHPALTEFGMGYSDYYKIKRTITGQFSTTSTIKYSFLDSVEYDKLVGFDPANQNPGYTQVSFYYNNDTLKKPANAGYILPSVTPLDSFAGAGWLRINTADHPNYLHPQFTKESRSIITADVNLDTFLNFAYCFFEGGSETAFAEGNGLGTTFARVGGTNTFGSTGFSEHMVYYKKGNLTGGHPIFLADVSDITVTDNNQVYPNPVTTILTIDLATQASGAALIYDMFGHLVAKTEIDKQKATKIDVTSLTPGMYILTLQNRSGYRRNFKIQKM